MFADEIVERREFHCGELIFAQLLVLSPVVVFVGIAFEPVGHFST